MIIIEYLFEMKGLDERSRGIEILIADDFAMIKSTEPFRLVNQASRVFKTVFRFFLEKKNILSSGKSVKERTRRV